MTSWRLAGGHAGTPRRIAWLLLALLLIVIPTLDLVSTARATHGSSCPLHGNPMLGAGTVVPPCPLLVRRLLLRESPRHRSLAGPTIFIPPRA